MRLEDLPDDTCEGCGAPMPDNRDPRRTTYCSNSCRRADWNRIKRETDRTLRADAIARRPPCAYCGKPIPAGRILSALYCGSTCNALAYRRRRSEHARSGLTCAECGGTFAAPRRADQLHCSARCRETAKKVRRILRQV